MYEHNIRLGKKVSSNKHLIDQPVLEHFEKYIFGNCGKTLYIDKTL